MAFGRLKQGFYIVFVQYKYIWVRCAVSFVRQDTWKC